MDEKNAGDISEQVHRKYMKTFLVFVVRFYSNGVSTGRKKDIDLLYFLIGT